MGKTFMFYLAKVSGHPTRLMVLYWGLYLSDTSKYHPPKHIVVISVVVAVEAKTLNSMALLQCSTMINNAKQAKRTILTHSPHRIFFRVKCPISRKIRVLACRSLTITQQIGLFRDIEFNWLLLESNDPHVVRSEAQNCPVPPITHRGAQLSSDWYITPITGLNRVPSSCSFVKNFALHKKG